MQPLSGLRVVDLADEKGELCGRLLADLGAEVIRVEPPGGALSRRLPPFAPDGETSLYFGFRNAGKRSRILDLDDRASHANLEALLADADILIESEHPGRLAALGLAPGDLLKRHPHLVITSISDFGQEGPYADYQSTNMIAVAMGGMMYRAGCAEKPPVVVPGSFAYDVAAGSAAYGTLLAFWKRLSTGRGQHVDVSAMEAVANLADWSLPNFSLNPTIGTRAGSGIYTLYRCADGYVRMIVLVARHWRALLEWVGEPEELMDPEYDQFINRLMSMDKIVPVLEGFFLDKKKIDIACEAQRRGIPATPLFRPGEVMENEHALGRGTFAKIGLGGGGLEAAMPSGFLTCEGARLGPRKGAPVLGEAGENGFSSNAGRSEFEALLVPNAPESADVYPLRGLRVIDFGVGAVGVEAARLLAEYGAEVIKIESSSAPDFIRVIMSSYMNPSFASSSRTKQSFGVDLKVEKGRALVRRLVADADVVIENNGTGAIERMGFGPAAMREINPRIVSFSSQMVGSYGPWKDWIGYGPNTHPVSGLQFLWNYPEDEESPAGSTAVYPDHFVGRIGAMAVLAGLIARERTGQGSHHDAAQFEVAIGLLGDLFAQESLTPGSVHPLGNASSRGAPWGCFPCADSEQEEWCVITVRSDEEWEGLRGAMGDPAWAAESSYRTAAGRLASREAIEAGLSTWTRQRSPKEAMEILQGVGVPCGIVCHPGHHMSDPQMLYREYAKPVEQQELSTILLEGPAFLGSDLPEVITQQAPLLGEHTRAIAERLLGLSPDEIEKLIDEGVLEDPPAEFRLV
ncbi:MAG TPA: CoA transferase [Myxococcales bacterium]|nr:CoA transferase [Myxococcales bacterium]